MKCSSRFQRAVPYTTIETNFRKGDTKLVLVKMRTRIRRQEKGFYKKLYILASMIHRFNAPAIRCLYVPLFLLRKFLLVVSSFVLQKFFYEPMFKVRCVKCGKGLKIIHGIPLLSDHLDITIGNNVSINGINAFVATTVFDNPSLEIGDNTSIGFLTTISVGQKVSIGKNCLIAERVFIADNNGHPLEPKKRHLKVQPEEIKPVSIGDNVWVGNQAFIGRGVSIGDGSVVGTNAVVVNDVPPNTIVMSSPARVARIFQQHEIMDPEV